MYVTLTVTYTWPASQMLCHGKVGHMKECTLTFLKQVAAWMTLSAHLTLWPYLEVVLLLRRRRARRLDRPL